LAEDALRKARCLHIPFDATRRIHLEYEGYVDKEIKQADVVLIGFPLMWPMDPQIRKNDLLYYENKTRINGPAMTWGLFYSFCYLYAQENIQLSNHLVI
jgi:hypothetical protein